MGEIIDLREAIINSAYNNATVAVKSLIEYKDVSVETEDRNGNSLMDIAIRTSNPELVGFLIEKGIDVNEIRKEMTPIQYAVQEIESRITEKKEEKVENAVNVLNMLIEAGADVNLETEKTESPLTMAIRSENVNVMGLLIEAGADVNSKDKNGNSMLHVAALSTSNVEILEKLIENGADLDAKNNNELTPYEEVLKIDNPDIANYLESKNYSEEKTSKEEIK